MGIRLAAAHFIDGFLLQRFRAQYRVARTAAGRAEAGRAPARGRPNRFGRQRSACSLRFLHLVARQDRVFRSAAVESSSRAGVCRLSSGARYGTQREAGLEAAASGGGQRGSSRVQGKDRTRHAAAGSGWVDEHGGNATQFAVVGAPEGDVGG